jgi:RES domain-containing protein
MGELARMAESQVVDVEDLIEVGRELHTVEIVDLPVLDLTAEENRAAVGLTVTDIAGHSWDRCQAIGHAAWFLGYGGVLAPSATGEGLVLAAFESRIDPGQVTLVESQRISIELYKQLRT